MTNITNLTLPGAQNGTGTDDVLFLKVFGGEVMAQFERENVMMDKHMVRTIASGKSAQFPATGQVTAGYHTPGVPLLGDMEVLHNERVIAVDDMLQANVFIDSVDEMKNHYDVRALYAAELGSALARNFDAKVQRVVGLAARATATVSGGNGGSAITNATAKTDGDSLAGSIFEAAQKLDEKDVPQDGRFCLVKPAQYFLLVQTTKVLNRDWGGIGSYAKAEVPLIADVNIVKTNNLPTANQASPITGERNTYTGDFTNCAALIFQKGAVGTVKLLDLTAQMTEAGGDFNVMYQGTLMVAKYVMGHGILRPESAVEVKTA